MVEFFRCNNEIADFGFSRKENFMRNSMNWRALIVPGLVLIMLACQTVASGTEEVAKEAPEVESTEAAETEAPPEPETEEPTSLPEPQAFSASDDVIAIGGFEFHVVQTAFENSVMGMKPAGGGSILFVELELLSGAKGDFEEMQPVLESASGTTSKPVALISGGYVKTLTSLTYTGESTSYQPDPENVTWAFTAARNASELYLVFPGEGKVDLSPVLK